LRKVALVRGSTLIYADTYEEALAQLQAVQGGKQVQVLTPVAPAGSTPGSPPTSPSTRSVTSGAPTVSDPRIDSIRMHLQRYRELAAQGKWADAGKELEAVEAAVKR
jgi:uncharacterized protein